MAHVRSYTLQGCIIFVQFAYVDPARRHDFVAVYELLTSPWLFSGNLYEPTRLASALTKIAKIDRLPADNNLGGLNALQFAWNSVDICKHVADQMKTLTKVK